MTAVGDEPGSPSQDTHSLSVRHYMKITFLSASISRQSGGVFEVERRLAQSLAARGNSMNVFGLVDHFTAEDLPKWKPIAPVALNTIGPAFLRYAPSYYSKLIETPADIGHLHVMWLYISLLATRWSAKTSTPFITTVNGMLDEWAVRHSAWKKKIALLLYERKALQRVSCLQVNTLAEYRSVRAFGITAPICIVENGIDLPNLSSAFLPPPWASSHFTGKKVLLYLGRVHPKKGIANLLRALARVKSEAAQHLNDWHLVVVGCTTQGGHERDLQRIAIDEGIQSHVSFFGQHFGEEMQSCYFHADAFILPSFSEGVPMAVLTAWAFAKPVLITPQCNLPEGYDARAALAIDPDVASITKGLMELFELSEAARMEMGQNGRTLAETNFSWHSVAEKIESVYKWILSGEHCPPCVIED